MVYKYEWKIEKYPVSANAAGKHMEKLERENGQITPELLLESSRDEESVMHPCFEWNDGKAAEKYRIVQAKGIINNIVCVAVSDKKERRQEPSKAFVNVSSGKEKGTYRSVQIAMNDESTRRIVLNNALMELKNFERKYNSLKELASVFEEIERVSKEISA